MTETYPRVETWLKPWADSSCPFGFGAAAWPAPEGASPLARRHRNSIGRYPTGAVIEDLAPEPGTPRAGSEKNCIQIIINYARPLILRDVLDDDFVRLARILEKQNSLQMSQVFPLRASLIRWALLFKDSKRGRFTQPMLLLRGLATPTPRRSEARPRLIVDGRLKPIDFATLVGIFVVFTISGGRAEAQFLSRTHVVEGNELKLGMSSAESGRLGFLGSAAKRGSLAFFARVNREGGISGRRVVLVDYDDRYEPIDTVSNTERLIDHDKVFALLNFLGTPTTRAILPMVSESNIVLLGPISGAELLRQPIQPFVFNTRASYREEAEMLVSHLVADLGVKRVALFRQDDSYGDEGHVAVTEALQRRGLQLVAEAGYVRNSVRAQDAVYHVAKANPDSVILFGTYKPCADFIRGAKQLGLKNTIFCNVSFVGTEPLTNYLGEAGDGVVISQVMPFPYDDRVPIVRAYQHDMQELGTSEFTYASFEGYLNALVMVTALKAAGPDLTEEKLVHSLESLDIDFKPFKIRFGPSVRQGSHQVFLTKIERGKAVPIDRLNPADYGR